MSQLARAYARQALILATVYRIEYFLYHPGNPALAETRACLLWIHPPCIHLASRLRAPTLLVFRPHVRPLGFALDRSLGVRFLAGTVSYIITELTDSRSLTLNELEALKVKRNHTEASLHTQISHLETQITESRSLSENELVALQFQHNKAEASLHTHISQLETQSQN